ncbi:MAG: outer membrane lipoprotein-sorting protein [Oligoflexia bacterium]|nr:outer membrane lipoprotein-sorting protein [Oligoflexia bacterium]
MLITRYILNSIFFITLGSNLLFGESPPNVEKILKESDRLYRADSCYAKIEMTIVNPNWRRTLLMDTWTIGMDRTMIRILEPKKDRGISTLRIKNEMWNFFPKIDKVMKIPPSMMMGSWMGSDFTNDDLVKESTFIDDYDSKLINPDTKDEKNYYIELKPRKETVSVWGKIINVVARDTYIPVRQEFFDEKDRKIRIITFSEIKNLGGKKLPVLMEVVPAGRKDKKTTIRYIDAVFNGKVPESVFSLRNLRKKI